MANYIVPGEFTTLIGIPIGAATPVTTTQMTALVVLYSGMINAHLGFIEDTTDTVTVLAIRPILLDLLVQAYMRITILRENNLLNIAVVSYMMEEHPRLTEEHQESLKRFMDPAIQEVIS